MKYSELGFDRASLIFNDPRNFPLPARVQGRDTRLSYQEFSRLVVQGVDFEIDDEVLEQVLAKYGRAIEDF